MPKFRINNSSYSELMFKSSLYTVKDKYEFDINEFYNKWNLWKGYIYGIFDVIVYDIYMALNVPEK